MENTQPYQDSPPSSRPSTPATSSAAPPRKPRVFPREERSLPHQDSYRDTLSPSAESPSIAQPQPQPQTLPRRYHSNHRVQTYFPPYTDSVPGSEDNDDVPLGYLYPYPTEAPPAYNVVVRESYRDTLIAHIPTHSGLADDAGGVDEEAGVEMEYHDDVRFRVEKAVAAFVVAFVLFILSGLMVGFVLFWRNF